MKTLNKINTFVVVLSVIVCFIIFLAQWYSWGSHLVTPKFTEEFAPKKGGGLKSSEPAKPWNETKIIQAMTSSDLVSVMQALFHVWENISMYKNNVNVLNSVLIAGLSHEDIRISGLVGLIITMKPSLGGPLHSEQEVQGSVGRKDEAALSEPLVAQLDRIDSNADEVMAQSIKEELLDGSAEDKVLYLSDLVKKNDANMIDLASQLIRESTESVQLVVTSGLISFLQQGVGDPQKIIHVLAENIDFLSVQQIDEVRESIARPSP